MTFLKFYIFILSFKGLLSLLRTTNIKKEDKIKTSDVITLCIAELIFLFIASFLIYYGFKYSGIEMINLLKNIF